MKAKLILFLFASTFYANFLFCQNWLDFDFSNTSWTTYYGWVGNGAASLPFYSRHFSTAGDTLINEKIYLKLVANSIEIPFESWIHHEAEINSYVGAVKQEDHLVFFIPKDSSTLDTLYNYELAIATITDDYSSYPDNNCIYGPCPYIKLFSIDTIILDDNIPRRRLNFHAYVEQEGTELHLWPTHAWIEGLGSTTGFLDDHWHILDLVNATKSPHKWIDLLCINRNSELLYTGEFFEGDCDLNYVIDANIEIEDPVNFEIFPNPARGKITIKSDRNALSKNAVYEIRDLNGILIIGPKALNSPQIEVDITKINKGLIFLTIKSDLMKKTWKIVKVF